MNLLTFVYHQNLLKSENKRILNYIYSRGISQETINHFEIGYCCNDIGIKYYEKNNFIQKFIEECPLFFKTNDYHDKYNGYITIPIKHKSETVNFTGRKIIQNDNYPDHKHLGIPITYVFNHNAVYKSDKIFVTEGPFDCMTLHQNGFSAVATLGCYNLSRKLVEDLSNKTVFIVFDSDENESGKNGAIRLATLLNKNNIKSYIIFLPRKNKSKIDINDYFKENSIFDFVDLVKNAFPSKKFIKEEKKKLKTHCEIIQKPSIIDIASKYLDIQYVGNRAKAICPFHKESKPSMILYDTTETYFCFGCGRWGDAYTLIQELEKQKGNNLNFFEIKKIVDSI